MIDNRRDRLDLGERAALLAEIVDDARLGRPDFAGDRRVSSLEADDAAGQFGFREFPACGVENPDRAQLEKRTRVDLDDNRRGARLR